MDTDVINKAHELHLTAPFNPEKLSPLISNPIPTLKLKKSFVLSNSPEHQPSCKASIRTVRARLSLCKKPSNITHDLINPKNPNQSGNLLPSAHRRADSETHARHPSPIKDDSSASRQKKDLIQEQTIKSAIEKSSALKELLRPPQMHKRAPSGGIPVMPKAGISLNSLAMANELSKKSIDQSSTKDAQDSHEVRTSYKYLDAIKAAVFSENKNRMGLHQKRLFAQKEKTANLEALFTPKTNIRQNESPPRQSTKTLFSPELQMLKEALTQQLPGNSFQESSINDPNSTKHVIKLSGNRENQLPRALGSASRQNRKRGGSGERSSILVNISGEKESPTKKESLLLLEQVMSRNLSGKDKEMPKVTKEEEAKSEKAAKNERVKAVEEELKYFKEFLEVEKQTFEFEKAMAAQRSKAKTRKESMYISVASPSARRGQNDSQRRLHERSGEAHRREIREGEMMGPFSVCARDSKDSAALTGDSSKNGQGSTTCSSSKLSKEISALRREQSFGFGEAVKVMDVDEMRRRKKSRIISKSSFKQE